MQITQNQVRIILLNGMVSESLELEIVNPKKQKRHKISIEMIQTKFINHELFISW